MFDDDEDEDFFHLTWHDDGTVTAITNIPDLSLAAILADYATSCARRSMDDDYTGTVH
jgi:hypothetical protein